MVYTLPNGTTVILQYNWVDCDYCGYPGLTVDEAIWDDDHDGAYCSELCRDKARKRGIRK